MCIDKSGHHDHAFRIEIPGKFDLSFLISFIWLSSTRMEPFLITSMSSFMVMMHIEYNCSCHSLNFMPKLVIFPGRL